jgi:hypothetical protein
MHSVRRALRELDIGPELQPGQLDFTGAPMGVVVAGSIAALDSSVSEQHGHDVLQSLLLAQLAANAKANRYSDTLNWYRAYQSTLESVGWIVSASTGFTRFIPQVSRYTISTVITDLFRPKATPEELSLVNSTLAAFIRDPTAPGQFIWECPSHSGGIGNFQFALAAEEEDDNIVTLQLGRFTFEVPVHVTRLAFEEFGTDAKFSTSYVAMTLNEQVFSSIRNAITAKLASRFDGSVAEIELR